MSLALSLTAGFFPQSPFLPGSAFAAEITAAPLSQAKYTALLKHFETLHIHETSKSLDSMAFFKVMGKEKISMMDLTNFKGEYVNKTAENLQRNNKMSLADAQVAAIRQWDSTYGTVERRLMNDRANVVKRVLQSECIAFAKKHRHHPITIMNIGSWMTEAYHNRTFAGDIDITLMAMSAEVTGELVKQVSQALQREFNLSAEAVDVIITGQYQAGDSVYRGDINAWYLERGIFNSGNFDNFSLIVADDNGVTLQDKLAPLEIELTLNILRHNTLKAQGRAGTLSALMADGLPDLSVGGEPMVSLELLRHLHVDVVQQSFGPAEQLMKLSKYLKRSMDTLPDVHTAEYNRMMHWADAVDTIRSNKTLDNIEKLRRILKASETILGNPKTVAELRSALTEFGNRVERSVKRNVDIGVEYKRRYIADERTRSPQVADADVASTIHDLLDIQKAYERKNIPFPESAAKLLSDLQGKNTNRTLRIPAAEQERMRRIIKQYADKPDGLSMALAVVWQQTCKYYSKSNEAMDALNGILDTLDNHTLDYVRAWDKTLFNITVGKPDGGFYFHVPINIAKINQHLNNSVLGKIGNSLPFKAYNLYTQAEELWQALNSSDDWKVAAENVSMVLIRNWLPGAEATEAAVMGEYWKAGVKVVYLFFPTLAIPEAMVGMGQAFVQWSYKGILKANYDEMVEILYKSSTFNQNADGTFTLTGVSYPLSGGKNLKLGRNELHVLPEQVPHISNVLISQVR
ncbi:hypothetical protein LJC36_02810, partial [Desulfovibrio sp. OttesenSCG-928-C14]|nr:hypothetical protein [Desulfovibrio sp. OttesenSCG-928-C14]